MFLPDNIQTHLRNSSVISINEVAKKEGDLYVAVNVIDQQRRIITVDHKLIESMMSSSRYPGKRNTGGLLKG